MKVPMVKMKSSKILKSKAMVAGLGSIAYSIFLASNGEYSFSVQMFLFGLGIMGVRDANED